MLRQLMTLTFVAVGTYLVLAYATGAGRLLSTAGDVYVRGVRTLQGR
jgi:hypothetical protein